MHTKGFNDIKKNRGVKNNNKNIEVKRILRHGNERRMKYREYKCNKGTLHWGQRKLLLSEIEFMNKVIKENKEVRDYIFLYVGAAPGTHLISFARMFKDYLEEIILYDTADFDNRMIKEIKDMKVKIRIYKEYFTRDEAKKYIKIKNLLFCSDIRSGNPPNDKNIVEDMKLQMDCVLIIKPIKTILKFRLLWIDGKTKYISGVSSIETRLICGPEYTTCYYDNRIYEEEMMFYNTRTRREKNIIFGGKYDDHCTCNDCNSEIKILSDYLSVINDTICHDNIITLYRNINHDLLSTITEKTLKKNIIKK